MSTPTGTRGISRVRKTRFTCLAALVFIEATLFGHMPSTHANQAAPRPAALPPIDCSTVSCDSLDQRTILGNQMFDERNFTTIVDGFGHARSFYVHIPATYDAVDGVAQKVPLMFAFHGGGSQTREAMVTGKWEDYFDQDIAFVIPLSGADPCENPGGNGKSHWMQAGMAMRSSPGDVNCDPATEVVNGAGQTRTYWKASLPATFTDVLFVEELRAMLLARFPKLNADKVYATGFSSGGGMTYMLACYRASLFRGFSVVAKTLGSDSARGDIDDDGLMETDPESLAATCGKNELAAGHATGIAAPEIWGSGTHEILLPGGPVAVVPIFRPKPVALFAGNHDNSMQEINDTGDFVRARNNLNGTFALQNPFLDIAADDATTQRRTFRFADAGALPYAAFRRFLVQGLAGVSGTHAMPDAEECGAGSNFMTCDYSYTTQTKIFFEEHADLNLNP
jgi:poly(3-hydroxybutyrate) depolymerase